MNPGITINVTLTPQGSSTVETQPTTPAQQQTAPSPAIQPRQQATTASSAPDLPHPAARPDTAASQEQTGDFLPDPSGLEMKTASYDSALPQPMASVAGTYVSSEAGGAPRPVAPTMLEGAESPGTTEVPEPVDASMLGDLAGVPHQKTNGASEAAPQPLPPDELMAMIAAEKAGSGKRAERKKK